MHGCILRVCQVEHFCVHVMVVFVLEASHESDPTSPLFFIIKILFLYSGFMITFENTDKHKGKARFLDSGSNPFLLLRI